MANYGSPDVGFVLINGYSLAGTLTQFNDKVEALTEDNHGLGTSWRTQAYTGLRRGTFSQEGFYDDGTNSAHEALSANLATSKVLCYTVEGNTTGKRFVGFQGALQVNYERVVSRGELHKARAEYLGNGQVDQGRILRPLSGVTASGNTTANGMDGTASSTAGGAGYFQLTSFSSGAGATGLAVDILDSPDNLTYSSWKGFTVATAAPLAERVVSTAPIQRYTAVKWQGASGAGAPASCAFFVGLARF